jgi:DNA-binding NtrC family response regulator
MTNYAMAEGNTREAEVLRLLLVTCDDQHELSLRAMLDGASHAIIRVSDFREAARLLEDLIPSVVLVDANLPAGDWKRFLERMLNFHRSSELIVFSHLADNGLWAEVLNRGGYDVLAVPFDAEEVRRTISLASGSQARKLAWDSLPTRLAAARSATAA